MFSRQARLVVLALTLAAALVPTASAVASDDSQGRKRIASVEEPTPAANSAPWELADFEAIWVRVDRVAEDEAREEALLSATESMSLLLRGPTRLYMRRTMVPADRYAIRVQGRKLTIAREPGETTTFDLDAPAEGATLTYEGGFLQRDWRHDESTHGTTSWRLSADGARMAVRRVIRNAILGSPADYTTTYARER